MPAAEFGWRAGRTVTTQRFFEIHAQAFALRMFRSFSVAYR
jgi:hypothetical protein